MRSRRVARRAAGVFAATLLTLTAGCADGSARRSTAPASVASTTSAPPTATPEFRPRTAGWTVVLNPDAALAYDVPPAWHPADPDRPVRSPSLGAQLRSTAALPEYPCAGRRHVTALVGSIALEPGDPTTVATSMARGFGHDLFTPPGAAPATMRLDPTGTTSREELDGTRLPGVAVTATVLPDPTDECLPTRAVLRVVVLDGRETGGATLAFVATAVSEGGPPAARRSGAPTLDRIITSLRLTV